MLLAFVLRLLIVTVGYHDAATLHGDETDYVSLGQRIADGDGIEGPRRPPGYPVFLSGVVLVQRATGADWPIRRSAGAVQALLAAATVGLVGLLGRRVGGARVGLVAAGLLAIWPNELFAPAFLLSETLFAFVLVAALERLYPADDRPGLGRLLAGGALLGAAVLTRPVAIPVVLVAVLMVTIRSPDAFRKTGLVVLAGSALAMAPWTLANAVQYHGLAISSADTGFQLCVGNHPGELTETSIPAACKVDGNPIAEDRRLTREALDWRWHHPGTELDHLATRVRLLVRKDHWGLTQAQVARPHGTLDDAVYGRAATAFDLWWLALLGGALLAIPKLWRSPVGRPLLLSGAALVLGPILVVGDLRYGYPLHFLVAIGAALTAIAAYDRLRASWIQTAERPRLDSNQRPSD